jgi:hypothetical protein
MGPEEAHSDHRWGPRAEDSTMCKHREEVGKARPGMAGEDTGEEQADGMLVQDQGQWALVGPHSWR